jgi:HD-GYP domain-containing protein (c-di-GMP phosphodiesterase class II)
MGLAQDQIGELEVAARLHDVGKIGVPDAVLRKQGPLEGGEWEIMRQHPAWGADMLSRVPGLKRVSRIVRHAHERWDGDGYPDRLRRDDIPLASRIIFACDAYNAMTSDRPYRDALRPWIAVSELREGAGGQFDPDVVDALVGALREQHSIELRLRRRSLRATRAASCRLAAGAIRTDSPRRRKRLACASCTARVGPGRGAEDCALGRRMWATARGLRPVGTTT